MDFLQQEGCTINILQKYIQFSNTTSGHKSEDASNIIPLLSMQTKECSTRDLIERKVSDINGVDERNLCQLKQILLANQEIFDSRPGRIQGYQHSFRVTDDTPYMQKGWPVPLTYRRAVKDEIQRMLDFGVIEWAYSPYVNPLVTVIKKDGQVRLCLDARKINSVTMPDYEGPPPINEILAQCSSMRIMSTIDLTISFWQVPLREECRDFTGFLYDGKCYRLL